MCKDGSCCLHFLLRLCAVARYIAIFVEGLMTCRLKDLLAITLLDHFKEPCTARLHHWYVFLMEVTSQRFDFTKHFSS